MLVSKFFLIILHTELVTTFLIMRKILIIGLILTGLTIGALAQSYEYKVVTSIESIVPMGMGRSRIVQHNETADYKKFTTARTAGKDTKSIKVKRADAKIENLEETKLLNFYSGVGINMQNIASNDALISSKINTMVEEGWELAFVLSGVESDAGKGDGKGIFITRYIFKKRK